MIVMLPPASAPMAQILDTIRRAFGPVVSHDEASPRLLLRSPSGKTYELTVDDAGVLSTAVIDGKTRP